MENVANAAPRGELVVRYLAAQSVTTIQNYALAVLFTVLIFCVRLVVLALTIPLFALAAFTGLVDGLVRRDLRRFGSGRESSYLYHKARGTIIPLAIFPWTFYLALPISISPMLDICGSHQAVSLGISQIDRHASNQENSQESD
ncbi:TIGR03747 family integrating conjugative element membrane protein [Pseudomonas guariconensis]|uniref:TIGR03747 family integrating conjugative element membrane protein n=1 Tax=Pseudomonas guariconensis TaxID=1288410 RepID=UPI003A7F1DFC